MALVVVGGQTKNVGKTTLVCNIIQAFPQIRWTAVKISNHAHAPEDCERVQAGAGWTIWQQRPTNDHTDTARFLRSGAERGLLILHAGKPALREACTCLAHDCSAGGVIVESASAAQFLDHDLLLMLLDPAHEDLKESARRQFDRVDAFLFRNPDLRVNAPMGREEQKPIFTAFPLGLDRGLRSMLEAKLGGYG